MKSIVSVMVSALLLGFASAASADKVILKSGSSYDVRGFEITAGAVKMVTPEGKAWSVVKDIVDVPATLKANGMSGTDTRSPGWSAASTEVVSPKPEPGKTSAKYGDKESEKASREREREEKKAERERERSEKEAQKREAREERARERQQERDQEQEQEQDREQKQDREKKRDKDQERKQRVAEREPVKEPPRRTSSASGAAEEEPLTRYVVLVNGGFNGTSLSFNSARSFPLNLETGTIQSTYTGSTGPVFELGGMYRLRGPWAAGGTVELFGGDNALAFTASLPHPFFFNQPRTLQGTVPALGYRETAVNVGVFYSYVLRPQIVIDGFGGPTFFFTRTQILSDVRYTDVFPYNTVTLNAPVITEQTDAPVGFNVGGGVTYRWKEWLGFGFSVHYNRAKVSIIDITSTPVSFNAGGVRANGGVRLLFK